MGVRNARNSLKLPIDGFEERRFALSERQPAKPSRRNEQIYTFSAESNRTIGKAELVQGKTAITVALIAFETCAKPSADWAQNPGKPKWKTQEQQN